MDTFYAVAVLVKFPIYFQGNTPYIKIEKPLGKKYLMNYMEKFS